jgi:hypothetical protein
VPVYARSEYRIGVRCHQALSKQLIFRPTASQARRPTSDLDPPSKLLYLQALSRAAVCPALRPGPVIMRPTTAEQGPVNLAALLLTNAGLHGQSLLAGNFHGVTQQH